jgi:hypothetical protein
MPIFAPAALVCNKMFQPRLWKQLSGILRGLTFQHFVESWQCYLPHLPSQRSTQVVTNGPQVATNGSQVGTSGPQVGTNDLQVGANSQLGADIPNVFNACTKVCRLEAVFCMPSAVVVPNIHPIGRFVSEKSSRNWFANSKWLRS